MMNKLFFIFFLTLFTLNISYAQNKLVHFTHRLSYQLEEPSENIEVTKLDVYQNTKSEYLTEVSFDRGGKGYIFIDKNGVFPTFITLNNNLELMPRIRNRSLFEKEDLADLVLEDLNKVEKVDNFTCNLYTFVVKNRREDVKVNICIDEKSQIDNTKLVNSFFTFEPNFHLNGINKKGLIVKIGIVDYGKVDFYKLNKVEKVSQDIYFDSSQARKNIKDKTFKTPDVYYPEEVNEEEAFEAPEAREEAVESVN